MVRAAWNAAAIVVVHALSVALRSLRDKVAVEVATEVECIVHGKDGDEAYVLVLSTPETSAVGAAARDAEAARLEGIRTKAQADSLETALFGRMLVSIQGVSCDPRLLALACMHARSNGSPETAISRVLERFGYAGDAPPKDRLDDLMEALKRVYPDWLQPGSEYHARARWVARKAHGYDGLRRYSNGTAALLEFGFVSVDELVVALNEARVEKGGFDPLDKSAFPVDGATFARASKAWTGFLRWREKQVAKKLAKLSLVPKGLHVRRLASKSMV